MYSLRSPSAGLGSLAAWQTPAGATLEYSEWWDTGEWWNHYPSGTCEGQPPLELAQRAWARATREELVVWLSLLAQMHNGRAPSIAALLTPAADPRTSTLNRVVTASVGDEDCWVSKGSALFWGRPSNAEEHASQRFWEMMDRVTTGREPAPTPGPGAVYVGPGATEPATLPPASSPGQPSGPYAGTPGSTGPGPDDVVYDIPGITVPIDQPQAAGLSPLLALGILGAVVAAGRRKRGR